ncbi:Hypothetical protein BALAC2494_00413 [Bifidobacterium animalis subsp. lactis CNCM I-2494]|uniref:Uncharacterized protein n=2 Tax=Bifidobacterium animalis subsp. lactis TaxID=302911 RepID=A0A806FLY8_BIFAN|nr:Hypothetical protein BALAC2494_00413 [Bifidobacterium animalis subsp. lactis CNCM I-2494]
MPIFRKLPVNIREDASAFAAPHNPHRIRYGQMHTIPIFVFCIRRVMFIVHNAIRNLWRNKGRSVLIIIVATIIAAASTIGFAIVQAAQRARASALENTTIGAQISLDRNKIMQSANSSGQKPDMGSFGKAT